ncbi:MAG: hypothetical protein A3I68_03540 [Candidatus Melainabacteria bacterium RIFCSPLOWO2_02_FULL_35_15]|nr:MAG: hypothetical protein A3F80_03855 [Candidatus Melainabacteria bacterium RIFCSPLOWO2_12_FULL_35_11]OGI14674.1 MAG: hypothetical protein A3I68_03540 [Candidatus Melainabacteria bacterium RIFCSPLOWO2_02_FULL_35_15]
MDDSIKVDIEGNLYFEGQKLTHDKIIEFFKKLDFEKVDDKTYQLKWQNNNQTQRINIIPEDTIFIIKDVVKESNEIKLVINDETMEKLETSTLEFNGNIPYALIKRGRIKARFNRHAAFKLGEVMLGS